MKLLVVGDAHIRGTNPVRRKDNFRIAVLDKLTQVTVQAMKHNVRAVLQVGDLFDSPSVSKDVIFDVMIILHLLKDNNIDFITVFGQHDLYGHSHDSAKKSPTGLLAAARLVRIAGSEPEELSSNIKVYGKSWFDKEPPLVEKENNIIKILITHQMIANEALFPGHKFVTPEQALGKYRDFDIICCGDYHYPFHYSSNNRLVVNPGALVRKTISEKDLSLKPSVLLIDIDSSNKVRTVQIPLEFASSKEVFDFRQEEEENKPNFDKIVSDLRDTCATKIDWRIVLDSAIKKAKLSAGTTQVIKEIIQEARNGQ